MFFYGYYPTGFSLSYTNKLIIIFTVVTTGKYDCENYKICKLHNFSLCHNIFIIFLEC